MCKFLVGTWCSELFGSPERPLDMMTSMVTILHSAINNLCILRLPTWTKHDERICIITHCRKYLTVSENLFGGPKLFRCTKFDAWMYNERGSGCRWTEVTTSTHNHCTMWLTVWGKLLWNCNKLLYLFLHYIVMMIPLTCYQKYWVMLIVISLYYCYKGNVSYLATNLFWILSTTVSCSEIQVQ